MPDAWRIALTFCLELTGNLSLTLNFFLRRGWYWFVPLRYGGGETYVQTWPIEGQIRPEAPMVTGDSLAGQEYGSLTENYWLVSTGAAIHVSEDTPLFISNGPYKMKMILRIW